jgi:hypothetical protein
MNSAEQAALDADVVNVVDTGMFTVQGVLDSAGTTSDETGAATLVSAGALLSGGDPVTVMKHGVLEPAGALDATASTGAALEIAAGALVSAGALDGASPVIVNVQGSDEDGGGVVVVLDLRVHPILLEEAEPAGADAGGSDGAADAGGSDGAADGTADGAADGAAEEPPTASTVEKPPAGADEAGAEPAGADAGAEPAGADPAGADAATEVAGDEAAGADAEPPPDPELAYGPSWNHFISPSPSIGTVCPTPSA